MPEGVSGRELARQLGVSEKAVRKALASGRIAKLGDGTFDPVACRAAWSGSSDPARTKVKADVRSPHKPSAAPPVRTSADAQAAIALIKRVLEDQGVVVDVIGFAEARTADTILKAAERDLKIAQRRKELVPLAKVKEHVEKAFIGIRQAIQRMPSRHVPAMAAELGCDPAALDLALTKAIAAELDVLSSPVVRA